MKDGTYAISFDEYKPIGTDWIALYVNANNILSKLWSWILSKRNKKDHRQQKCRNEYF